MRELGGGGLATSKLEEEDWQEDLQEDLQEDWPEDLEQDLEDLEEDWQDLQDLRAFTRKARKRNAGLAIQSLTSQYNL